MTEMSPSGPVVPAGETQVLQLLMRHESIETTMKYYVGQDVEHAISVLWGES